MEPEDLFRILKIQYKEKGNRYELLCPLHDDHSPSAGFYKDTQRFYCYTCGLSLTKAQLYAKVTGEDPRKAKTIVGEHVDLKIEEARREKVRKLQRKLVRVIHELKEARGEELGREKMAEAYEVGSRILYLWRISAVTEEKVKRWWDQWYKEIEGWIQHGTSGSVGVTRDSVDDGIQEGVGEVPVMESEGTGSRMEGNEPEVTHGVPEG